MKVSLSDVKCDLLQLCDATKITKQEIRTYFNEFENTHLKILDLKEEN